MPADTPEEVHELFTKYFSAGDLDAVMSLYEPGATIVQRDTSVTGHAAIRQALSGFLALKGEFALQLRKTFQSDDIALLFSNWTIRGTGPDGEPVELEGQTSDVVRRQPDGTWLLVIDNPYGAEAAA